MKTTILIVMSLFAACLLAVPGTWAESMGYIDWRQNDLTRYGVLAAHLLPNPNNPGEYGGMAAVYGRAVSDTNHSYGGSFENYGSLGAGLRGDHSGGSGETVGGLFSANSPDGMAVRARSYASTGNAYGGHFTSDSVTGTAVYGEAAATSDRVTYGGYFGSASTKGVGVYGLAKSKTGKTIGGYFRSDSSTEGAVAVYGDARALQGKTYGGYFRTYSADGNAVYGLARKDKAGISGWGGQFISDGKYGVGVRGLATETFFGGVNFGGDFQSYSAKGRGVRGWAHDNTGVNFGVYGETESPKGYGVYSQGNLGVDGTISCTGNQKIDGNQIVGKNLLVKGNQTVTGTKSAVVKLKNGEGVSLYAVEASENWFEDFGSAKLTDGAAVVTIDSLYAETVNTEIDYHVFLTPRGECKGLYVTNQKGSAFDVRELNGGKSDIPFSYRIVAKRKGYEDVRLAKVKEETLTAMTTAEEDVKKGEAIGGRRKVK